MQIVVCAIKGLLLPILDDTVGVLVLYVQVARVSLVQVIAPEFCRGAKSWWQEFPSYPSWVFMVGMAWLGTWDRQIHHKWPKSLVFAVNWVAEKHDICRSFKLSSRSCLHSFVFIYLYKIVSIIHNYLCFFLCAIERPENNKKTNL